MKRKTVFPLIIISLFMMTFLPVLSSAEGGLLPSLTETVGVAMPSLGKALGRYPDKETENKDGSITDFYTNVSESDFNVFSAYLQQQKAELVDYKLEKGILTAEIRAKGTSFSLAYNNKSGEASVTYPAGTFDEWVKNAKNHFDTAQKLLAEGKAEEAYAEISAIPQFTLYGPADDLLKEDKNLAAIVAKVAAEKEAAATAKARASKLKPFQSVGKYVTFGTYPCSKEGKEMPIGWIVLDYDETNNKSLLLSKFGLNTVPYNKEYTDITWEQSTLRAWLNEEFLNKAFNAAERSAILITNVDNSSDQGYNKWSTDGGNDTQDHIFLLSYSEVKRYLNVTGDASKDAQKKPRVAPTAYAIEQGASGSKDYLTAEDQIAVCWWLRSPGESQSQAVLVNNAGYLSDCHVDYDGHVVRPAFWLNLESDIF